MSELVDSMQTLGFQDKNPMMFEMMLKISAKRRGENTTFVQFAEDLADLIVSTYYSTAMWPADSQCNYTQQMKIKRIYLTKLL